MRKQRINKGSYQLGKCASLDAMRTSCCVGWNILPTRPSGSHFVGEQGLYQGVSMTAHTVSDAKIGYADQGGGGEQSCGAGSDHQ